MMRTTPWRCGLAVTLAATFLWGCTGGNENDSGGPGAGGGGGEGGQVLRIGSFDASGNFNDSVLDVGVGSLAAGGSTTVAVSVVDSQGAPYSQPVDVAFTSTCVNQGLASIESPVSSSNGRASSTYVAEGCSITDTVRATINTGTQALTATGDIRVEDAEAGAIEFVGATPETLALEGTGGSGRSETSTVAFRLLDEAGGPLGDTDVSFSLNTQAGGLRLVQNRATSDSDGRVQTVVRAGSVATAVRVTATIDARDISTQSDRLTVTSGIPDNSSTSLSATVLNPEAGDYDNTTVELTVLLADHFNNPVPDGTVVNFTTEGGQIDGSCQTTGGQCTVEWRSSDPRPVDGRSTVLAYAIGEEAFVDTNGSGRVDGGETFYDLSEAFRDDDESGSRTASEEFFDFDSDGSFDPANGLYNGVLCVSASAGDQSHCDLSKTSLHVRDSLVLVMSGSQAVFSAPSVSKAGQGLFGPALAKARRSAAGFGAACRTDSVTLSSGSTTTFSVYISDRNGQPLPAETTVNASTTAGSLVSRSDYTWPSTSSNSGGLFSYTIEGDDGDEASNGVLSIEVATPKGVTSFCDVPVTQAASAPPPAETP